MVSVIISRVVILLFGTLYPAYASYKAVKTKNVKEYVKWMMYWIVFAFFTCVETFTDIFISWVPFYYEMKILFVLWLLSPATKGASILYRKFLHPQLARREKEIDTYIAKASDQGYSAILSLGSKGFNYATNVVLTTAIKSQAKITDHLRKSYSMNDLSGGPPLHRLHPEESEPEMDDETDNRLIEESYREEMMEKERKMSASQDEDDIHDKENRMHRRARTEKQASKEDPGLYRVDETEEEAMAKGGRKSYSHKEIVDASNAQSKTSSSPSVPVAARKGSHSDSAMTARKNSLSSQNVTARKNSLSDENLADRKNSSSPAMSERKMLSDPTLVEKCNTLSGSTYIDESDLLSGPTAPTVTGKKSSLSDLIFPDDSSAASAMKSSLPGLTRYMVPGTISGLKNAPDVKCNPFTKGVSTSVCNPYAKMSTPNTLNVSKNPPPPTPPDSPAPWRFRKDYSESAWK